MINNKPELTYDGLKPLVSLKDYNKLLRAYKKVRDRLEDRTVCDECKNSTKMECEFVIESTKTRYCKHWELKK